MRITAPLLAFAVVSTAAAQNQNWVRQIGMSENDSFAGAAPDGTGGVYVSGYTTGSLSGPNAGNEDVWLAHYDRAGNQAWIRQLGTISGDRATAVAPDGAGGVYLGGWTDGSFGGPSAGLTDAWLARYDSAGNQAWIRQLGTSTRDYVYAAAPDAAGGVYVSGYTHGSLGGPSAGAWDAWLAHYDGGGNQTWIRQLGTSDYDTVKVSSSDGAGGVYVAGRSRGSLGGPHAGGPLDDAWLARYDSSGSQTWIRQLGTSEWDFADALAPDGSGGAYVGGYTKGSLGGANPNPGVADAWLARYDGSGNQIWIRQFGTILSDNMWEAAPDGAGGVYVAGRTYGDLGGPNAGDGDVWLARYSSTGVETWFRQFGTTGYEIALGVASDGLGGAYISGHTRGSLGGPNAGGNDAWLGHYDGLLVSRYCSPANINSTGRPATLGAVGSNTTSMNEVTLIAGQLPQQTFGFFLTSSTQGLVVGAGGSQGDLCLGGSIGRYVGPGQVQNSGLSGRIHVTIDLANHPQPTGLVAVQSGETWNFQAWYRDANPGTTSNLTDAVSVTFQ